MGFVVVVTACVAVVGGFPLAPAASTDELPQSITADGIAHERVHLVTFKSYPGRRRVAVLVPATSRPVIVRAACRLAVLHTGDTQSALMVETWWTATGGNAADLPDTEGNEYLSCYPGSRGQHWLTQTVDPSWLPGEDGRRQLIWHELSTLADARRTRPPHGLLRCTSRTEPATRTSGGDR